MVVVVVLGILAGIAVQRMGDVRRRTEEATEQANIRILLGAANLARARNYGEYMFMYRNPNIGAPSYSLIGDYNSSLRWQRPCDGPPVTQLLNAFGNHAASPPNNYVSGYYTFAKELELGNYGSHGHWNVFTAQGATFGYYWRQNQDYNLKNYLESFPVGYAVEIVYAAHLPNDSSIIPHPDGNSNLYRFGYHERRGETENNPYDVDAIYIYKFIGEKASSEDWVNFGTEFLPGGVLRGSPAAGPQGNDGNYYPYHQTYFHNTLHEGIYDKGQGEYGELSPADWKLIFPIGD